MFEPLMQIVPLALLRRTRYHVGIDWLPDAIIRPLVWGLLPFFPVLPFLFKWVFSLFFLVFVLTSFSKVVSVSVLCCVGRARVVKFPSLHSVSSEKIFRFLLGGVL
jgi:hypothetical protein